MQPTRTTFLKLGGLATSAAFAEAVAFVPRPAEAAGYAAAPGGSQEMAKGLTFANIKKGNRYSLGIKTDKGILDVAAAEALHRHGVPVTIDDVFAGKGSLSKLKALVEAARADAGAQTLFLAENAVQFGPVVTNPEKIVCVGLNYRRHAQEIGATVPSSPVLFSKFNTSLNYHGGTVAVSTVPAQQFDYETELVIVMGKTTHNVSEDEALNYVFGYASGNDFTARDLQNRTSQWLLGKTNDGFAPIGPWIVSADQIPDPNNLQLATYVNGEERQNWNTNDMIFNCKQIISYTSKHMTLKRGDIIFTGTPQGVIAGKPKDQQVWLKPGDKVVTKIEKTGELHFTLT